MNLQFLNSDYVADAVMHKFRAGDVPANGDVLLLDAMPLIDLLRQRVVPEDIPFLLDWMNGESEAVAGLAVSLLRSQMRDRRVRAAMEEKWWVASPSVQNRLLWRLADCEDLDGEWRSRLFSFVVDEWETFRAFNRRYYGSTDAALSNLIKRIADPSFPNSKMWLYLCSVAAVVNDRETVRAIIDIAKSIAGSTIDDAAEVVLSKVPAVSMIGFPEVDIPFGTSRPICSYIAKAAYAELMSGRVPTDTDADWLNRLPIIDDLRSHVRAEDVPTILTRLDNVEGEVFGLLSSLLRNFSSGPEVQRWLYSRWASADAVARAHLMWRILDDPDLPDEWHQTLFAFVVDNWPAFHAVSLKFLGTPKNVVLQALKRIGDSSVPESKKWAYLCRVPEVADDQEAARALILLGTQSRDGFTRRVASHLLDLFFPEEPVAEPGSEATA